MTKRKSSIRCIHESAEDASNGHASGFLHAGSSALAAPQCLRVALMVAVGTSMLAGCGSTPVPSASRPDASAGAVQADLAIIPENTPDAFAFSIAIPQGLAPPGQPLEQAWYVLDANGTLRASIGGAASQFAGDVRPPRIIRHVAREERAKLYALLRDTNVFAVPSAGQAVGDAQEIMVEQATVSSQLQGAAMAGVWWTVGERRRSFVMVPVQKGAAQSDAAEVWKGLEQAVSMMREWMWKSYAQVQ